VEGCTEMSGARTSQAELEHDQVRAFLVNRGLTFSRLDRGSDPPDLIVLRSNLPPLEIEVTEYHPQRDRVGIEDRWRQLRSALDRSIEERSRLKGLSLTPIFRDRRLPRLRHHKAIAETVATCVEFIVNQGWIGHERCKVFFADHPVGARYRMMGTRQLVLPREEWPVLARHLSALYIDSFPWDGHLPTNNPQAQAGWCSPYPAAFLGILERKEQSVRRAIEAGKYSKGEGDLLLLIVCNVPGDLTSSIFGDENLEEVIGEVSFDFEGSVFDEVWLMEAISGCSQRLYPTGASSGEGRT
jgi:hypothetical protein